MFFTSRPGPKTSEYDTVGINTADSVSALPAAASGAAGSAGNGTGGNGGSSGLGLGVGGRGRVKYTASEKRSGFLKGRSISMVTTPTMGTTSTSTSTIEKGVDRSGAAVSDGAGAGASRENKRPSLSPVGRLSGGVGGIMGNDDTNGESGERRWSFSTHGNTNGGHHGHTGNMSVSANGNGNEEGDENGNDVDNDNNSSPGGGREGGGSHVPQQPMRHVFYVPSGLCLLSTRPESGAMRRALSAYWVAHGDEVLRAGSRSGSPARGMLSETTVAETEVEVASETNDSSEARRAETAGAVPLDLGKCGSGGSSNGSGARLEDAFAGECTAERGGAYSSLAGEASVGPLPWAEFGAQELRQLLTPFLRRQTVVDPPFVTSLRVESMAMGSERDAGGGVETTLTEAVRSQNGRNSAAETTKGSFSPDFAPSRQPAPRPLPQVKPAVRTSAAGCCGWEGLDFDPSIVLRCLSPRHLCMVVTALLCERKVVMVSARLSLLTMAGEVFR